MLQRGPDMGKSADRRGVSRVSGLLVVALAGLLVLVGGLVLTAVTVSTAVLAGGGQPGTPLAAERIDLTTGAVPIAVVGAFGDPAPGSDSPANSADGDRPIFFDGNLKDSANRS